MKDTGRNGPSSSPDILSVLFAENEENQELSVYSWPPGLEDLTTTNKSVATFLK